MMATDTGFDPKVWHELAAMGLTGLLIDEEYGGAGAGPVEMGIAMEEMGRALLVSPFLSTAVLVPSLLAEAGDAAECAAVLPRIAAGELIATVAFAEDDSARLPATIATSAGRNRRHLARHRLQAFRARRAVGGTVVRAGRDRRGPRRVRGRCRCCRPGRDTADHGRPDPQAMPSAIRRHPGTFDRTAGRRRRGVQRGAGRLRAAPWSASRPAARGARSKWPPSTPRPVTSSAARSAASRRSSTCAPTCCWRPNPRCRRHASSPDSFAEQAPSRVADLALAQAYCSDAFVFVAATNIQVHGGIGFTWEHPAHLVSAPSPQRRPAAGQRVVAPGTLPAADRSLSRD